MPFKTYLQEHHTFIFELDNVLYPEKDYLLQVYYLFAQFMEYTELLDATEVLKVMKAEYELNGSAKVFEATAVAYPLIGTYRKNYEGLHENARLPLKLLMFDNLLKFLQEIVVERKQIILYTAGSVMQQLNKIRQTEWNGLEQYLKVYFAKEVGNKPGTEGIDFIANELQVDKKDMLLIGSSTVDRQCADNAAIKYLQVEKLFVT